jgi:hypothetical protein
MTERSGGTRPGGAMLWAGIVAPTGRNDRGSGEQHFHAGGTQEAAGLRAAGTATDAGRAALRLPAGSSDLPPLTVRVDAGPPGPVNGDAVVASSPSTLQVDFAAGGLRHARWGQP